MRIVWSFTLLLVLFSTMSLNTLANEITETQFSCVFPQVPQSKVAAWMGPLKAALVYGGVNSVNQQTAFLALSGVATSKFSTFKEYGLVACQKYDGGCTYTGRGALMMRGLALYRKAEQALGAAFVGDPDAVMQVANAFSTAGWLWKEYGFSATHSWDASSLAKAASQLSLDGASVLALFEKAHACFVPPSNCTWYVVAQGETPTSIAAKFSLNVSELMHLNNWTAPGQIIPTGERVKLWCN